MLAFSEKEIIQLLPKCLKPSTLIAVPISKFENVLIENPELCIKVFKVLGEKIVDLQNRLEEQILIIHMNKLLNCSSGLRKTMEGTKKMEQFY